MAARYSKFFRTVHIVGDVCILNFSFFIVNLLYYRDLTNSLADHYVKQFLYINLFWLLASTLNKVYDLYRVVRFETIFIILVRTYLLHLLFIFSFVVLFKEYIYSYKLFAVKYWMFALLTSCWRLGFLYLLKFIRTQGLNFRNVIILGRGAVAEEMYHFFVNHPEHGYRFLGFFDNSFLAGGTFVPSRGKQNLLVGDVGHVKNFCAENNIDEIYCALPEVDNESLHDLIEYSEDNLIRFKMLPDFKGLIRRGVEVNFYDDIPVLTLRKEPLDNIVNRFVKRIFDIVFSLLVILLIFPWLIPIIAMAIKLTSPGPIFFKQHRSGLNNRSFNCFKFRSMYLNGAADEVQAKKNDPRITWVGRILRKTSLDEIPQFFNVLIGNMSVVGPRPHMLHHTEKYSKVVDNFMVRHFVKPGITGLAQVKGFRGETTEPGLMEKRIQHDLWYIENWSLVVDIKIIILTVFNLLKGDKNAI